MQAFCYRSTHCGHYAQPQSREPCRLLAADAAAAPLCACECFCFRFFLRSSADTFSTSPSSAASPPFADTNGLTQTRCAEPPTSTISSGFAYGWNVLAACALGCAASSAARWSVIANSRTAVGSAPRAPHALVRLRRWLRRCRGRARDQDRTPRVHPERGGGRGAAPEEHSSAIGSTVGLCTNYSPHEPVAVCGLEYSTSTP